MRWLLFLFCAWPVLLPTGLVLGLVVLHVSTPRGLWIWSLNVVLLSGIGYVLFLGEGIQRYMLFVKLCLGLALVPAVGISILAGRSMIRRNASQRTVFIVTAVACLLASPIVAVTGLALGCLLTADCL
jgi:hypothetical protein